MSHFIEFGDWAILLNLGTEAKAILLKLGTEPFYSIWGLSYFIEVMYWVILLIMGTEPFYSLWVLSHFIIFEWF